MKRPNYLKLVRWSDTDKCYIGSIPDICGDCCHGDTQLEVYKQLIDVETIWLDTFEADKKPYPAVKTKPMTEVVA